MNGLPFVIKSSRRKVELLILLDADGAHRLSNAVGHLYVLHSRVKGWRTYTLSYYDNVLRQENRQYCELFFTKINEMMTKCITKGNNVIIPVVFNPYHPKDDEHGGKQNHHGSRVWKSLRRTNKFMRVPLGLVDKQAQENNSSK